MIGVQKMNSDLLEVCKAYKKAKELKLGQHHKTKAIIIEKKDGKGQINDSSL